MENKGKTPEQKPIETSAQSKIGSVALDAKQTQPIDSFEQARNKLYETYERRLRLNNKGRLAAYLSMGVTESIRKGNFDSRPEDLLYQGFFSREDATIHEKIDPEDTKSKEAILAEAQLRFRIHNDLLNGYLEKITPEMEQRALKYGSTGAILRGATINQESNKVFFSIPPEKAAQAKTFMEKAGIDFEKDDSMRDISYRGFINIIEAIKDQPKLTQKGFQALDWYFDSFNYQDHLEDFIDELDGYASEADYAFKEKLDEYKKHQTTLVKWQKANIAHTSASESERDLASNAKKVASKEELFHYLFEKTQKTVEEVELLKHKDANSSSSTPNRSSTTSISGNGYPNEAEKCHFAIHKIAEIIEKYDESADLYRGKIFNYDTHYNEETGQFERYAKKTRSEYVIIRFGANDHNNIIAIPIDDESAAMFVWRGQTGDNAEAWRTYFQDTSIRSRSTEVKRHVCNGYSKMGHHTSLSRQWKRAENDLKIELSNPQSTDDQEL